ncbi:MAG: SDR family oxidoreductase [Candidatus Omnitrophica bacterium]|nr:SDR family oxidoreductase [Candidatus Omnitrophota bacterium]
MKSYLVTGGAGFIGSNIVEALVRRGEMVKVIDNFITGKRENLKPFLNDIELVEGDIRDLDLMKRITKGVDYVLHQAAFRSVPKSVENPNLCNDINITGTLNVLIAAHNAKVKRVVYASSSAVYGDVKKFPQKEDFLPRPISPYGVSKLAGEYYCKVFNATFGLETVSLRYFNVFGPRQNPESKYSAVIPAFISRMLEDRKPIVDGDGKQSRDFTYVSNVVEANLKAAAKKGISGQVINIACGDSYAVLDIIKILNRLLHKDIKPIFNPPRRGDARKTQADIKKLKNYLGIIPKVKFEEGLEKTLQWFRNNPFREI